jgi:hypothetical protein
VLNESDLRASVAILEAALPAYRKARGLSDDALATAAPRVDFHVPAEG